MTLKWGREFLRRRRKRHRQDNAASCAKRPFDEARYGDDRHTDLGGGSDFWRHARAGLAGLMRSFFNFVYLENKCSDFVERAVKPRRSCRHPITRLRSRCAPTSGPTSSVVHNSVKIAHLNRLVLQQGASPRSARANSHVSIHGLWPPLEHAPMSRLCPAGTMHSYTSKLKSIHWSNHWRLPKSSLPGSPKSSPAWAMWRRESVASSKSGYWYGGSGAACS